MTDNHPSRRPRLLENHLHRHLQQQDIQEQMKL
jgi:hypothetical protein